MITNHHLMHDWLCYVIKKSVFLLILTVFNSFGLAALKNKTKIFKNKSDLRSKFKNTISVRERLHIGTSHLFSIFTDQINVLLYGVICLVTTKWYEDKIKCVPSKVYSIGILMRRCSRTKSLSNVLEIIELKEKPLCR